MGSDLKQEATQAFIDWSMYMTQAHDAYESGNEAKQDKMDILANQANQKFWELLGQINRKVLPKKADQSLILYHHPVKTRKDAEKEISPWFGKAVSEKLENNSIEETFAKVLGIDISELETLMKKADMPLGDYMELTIVLDNDGHETDMEGLHDFIMGDPKYANIFGDYLPLVAEAKKQKKPAAPRDPNWKTNLAKRQSGAAGAHEPKKYTKKDRKQAKSIDDLREKTLVGSEPNEKAKDPPNTQDQGSGIGAPGMTAKKGKSGQPGFVGGESIDFSQMTEGQINRALIGLPKETKIVLENLKNLSIDDLKMLHADLRGYSTPGMVEQAMSIQEMTAVVANHILSEKIHNQDDAQIAWNNEGKSDKVWGWYSKGNGMAVSFWGRRGKTLRFKEVTSNEARNLFQRKIHERGYVDISRFRAADEILGQAKSLSEEMSPAELQRHMVDLDREAHRPGSDVSVDVDGKAVIGDLESLADDPENPGSKVAVIKNKVGGDTTLANIEQVSTIKENEEFYYIWVDYNDGHGFQPHMTFPKTAEGRSDAKFEIQDLKDHGNKAKNGEPFPKIKKIDESIARLGILAGIKKNHKPAKTTNAQMSRVRALSQESTKEMSIRDILAMDRKHAEFKHEEEKEEKRQNELKKSNQAAGMTEGEEDYWECGSCGSTNDGTVCSSCGSEHLSEDEYDLRSPKEADEFIKLYGGERLEGNRVRYRPKTLNPQRAQNSMPSGGRMNARDFGIE